MVALGVFLIPPPEHPFYRIVTGIIGYDLWTGRRSLSALAGDLDAATLEPMLRFPGHFGTHCTLAGTALIYDDADVDEIQARLEWIAGRTAPFTLVGGRFDAQYRSHPRTLVATFESPDGALQRLHRQVVTTISPLHVRSNWSPSIGRLPERPRELYARTGEPWTLELFAPHWSLLDNLPDTATWNGVRDLVVRRTGLFADEHTRTLQITEVHLVERTEDGFCTIRVSYPLAGR